MFLNPSGPFVSKSIAIEISGAVFSSILRHFLKSLITFRPNSVDVSGPIVRESSDMREKMSPPGIPGGGIIMGSPFANVLSLAAHFALRRNHRLPGATTFDRHLHWSFQGTFLGHKFSFR
jgi:hypothetical protein